MSKSSEYNEVILTARDGLGDIQRQARERLIALLIETLVGIVNSADSGELNEERAYALSQNIRGQLARLGVRMRDTLVSSANAAEQSAITAHINAVGAVGFGTSFGGVDDMLSRLLVTRRGFAEIGGGYSAMFTAVMKRNLQPIAADIDRFLFDQIQRGTSAKKVAKELALMVADSDPVLKQIIEARYKGDFDPKEVARARSLVSDFKRIAVHEINSAHDEADKAASIVNPIIRAVKWTTSGRHDGLPSSPDACDVCEELDAYGIGPGVYPPEYAPSLLHPHCLCACEKVLLPVEQWAAGRNAPPSSRILFTQEHVGAIMGRRMASITAKKPRSITPKHIEAQFKVLNEKIAAAFSAWQQASRAAG